MGYDNYKSGKYNLVYFNVLTLLLNNKNLTDKITSISQIINMTKKRTGSQYLILNISYDDTVVCVSRLSNI